MTLILRSLVGRDPGPIFQYHTPQDLHDLAFLPLNQ